MLIFEEVQKVLETMKELEKGLEKYLGFISKVIRRIEEGIEYNREDTVLKALENYAEEQPLNLIQSNSAVKRLTEMFYNGHSIYEIAMKVEENSGVKLYVGEEMLCVRTPHLSSRNKNTIDRRFGGMVYNLLDKNRKALPTIKSKCIVSFDVYSSKKSDCHKVDPDNLDTKNIVDQISKFYSGDSGGNTIYISMIYISDEIPEGTYIICAPKEKRLYFEEEVFEAVCNLTQSEAA